MTYLTLPRAPVAGTHLCYERAGDGPVVVLLHGFSLDLRMWDDQVAARLPGFDVLRYDLRGYGRSDLPAPGVPYRAVDDLRALLDHLGISKVHLVGFSAGGVVAIQFALEYPALVDRLVLADSSLDEFDWSEELSRIWGRIGLETGIMGVEAGRRLWLDHPFFETTRYRPTVRDRLEEMVGEYSGWHWLHEDLGTEVQPPANQRLGDVPQPTLVLVGEHDVPDFQRIARRLAEQIPRAELAVVPGAGHMVNMEAPEVFNRHLLGFLGARR
jgi:pimeloyl-ACP methyl ester carboxylesterase